MGLIHKALFPGRPVSCMVVDGRMEDRMKRMLSERGIELLELPGDENLQEPVSGHPDMQLVHIGDNLLVAQPWLPSSLLDRLRLLGFDVRIGETHLKAAYPFDIAYNVAILGKVAFHNTRYTDRVLAELLARCSIRLVHVNQGYSKCSVLAVTPESLITADPCIARAASENGFDVLHLKPQTRIRLKGFDYGFIGGTAGFIDRDLLAFAGTPEALEDVEDVEAFLAKYGVRWLALGNDGLYDHGGLIPLCER